MASDVERRELIEIWNWERANLYRRRMIFEQGIATAMAALRGYEFEWLPRASILEWARVQAQ